MDHYVQWLGHLCVERNALTQDTLKDALSNIGEEADMQMFIDYIVEHELFSDNDLLQELIDQAWNNASEGLEVPSVAEETTEKEASEEEEDKTSASVAPPIEKVEETIPPESKPLPASENAVAPSEISSLIDSMRSLEGDELKTKMIQLIQSCQEMGASDLHLSATARPFLRLNRRVEYLGETPLSPEESYKFNTSLLSPEEFAIFKKDLDLDYALTLGNNNRYRVNLMEHKNGLEGTYRIVPDKVKSLEELGFKNADIIKQLLTYHNGLILVTGPLGTGKTTTLAAMVDEINRTRKDHVITVEDPIEIVQESKNCIVTQRQVGEHTNSFAAALKGALREDPDIIVIGELRDLETIEMAITASETGHLVIGTMHTSDARTTLNRLLDVFPPAQQAQIRAMTAESLRGIVCQRLLPANDGSLALACETLINVTAVGSLIRDGKEQGIQSVLETGSKKGMIMMDNSILELWQEGKISDETALSSIGNKVLQNTVRSGQRNALPAASEKKGPPPPKKGPPPPAPKKKGLFRR